MIYFPSLVTRGSHKSEEAKKREKISEKRKEKEEKMGKISSIVHFTVHLAKSDLD